MTIPAIHQEMKRKFVLEQLLSKGVTRSQQGTNIYECSYEELKYELVLQAFRDVDLTKDENRWF
jgi:hypothetical protein